ncbi:MAG: hypothetical protein ACOH1I_01490 [Gallionellaceae bacterium]
MQRSFGLIFLMLVLMAGCSSNTKRAFYEGIKNQNEAYKTPAERAMNPSPSFDTYTKEKGKLP